MQITKEARKGNLGEVCTGNVITYCMMEQTSLGTAAHQGPGMNAGLWIRPILFGPRFVIY